MKRKLHTAQVAAAEASAQRALPDEVVVSLAKIAGVAKEGLLALVVRSTQRNLKRWRSGDMRQCWTAAGMLEAERHFRRVKGHHDLAKLTAAIHRELHPTEEAATVQAA